MNGEKERPRRVPLSVMLLSAAGLLPPLMALFVRLAAGAQPESPLPGTIGALGLIYSALILSFLGGIWWGVAVARVTAEELPPLLPLPPDPLPQAAARLKPAQMATNATVVLRFIRLTRLLV